MLRPLLALIGTVALGCQPMGPPPEILEKDIAVRLGPHNARVTAGWSAVEIRVQNRGATFNGVLEVRGHIELDGNESADRVLYRQAADIPGGGTAPRLLSFPVHCGGWSHLTVTLRQPGYVVQRVVPLAPGLVPDEDLDLDGTIRTGADLQMLVYGDAVPSLVRLKRQLTIPSRATLAISPAESPRKLPIVATAFDPYYLVVLHGTTLEDALGGAVEALRRWVERGGSLLVMPGPAWSSGLPAALQEFLSIERGVDGATPEHLALAYGKTASTAHHVQLRPTGKARLIADGLAVEARRDRQSPARFSPGATGA